jgi:O-antigen ligase
MIKQVEKAFTIVMLFYLTGAVFNLLAGADVESAPMEGNTKLLVIQIALYAVAFVFMAISYRSLFRAAWKAKWVGALVIVAVLSTAWSQDPYFTFRRGIVLVATTAFGLYFGSRYTVREQLHLLAWACGLVILSSVFIAVFFPGYGVDHVLFPGAWKGAFPHKNAFGRILWLSALVFYFARPRVSRWVLLAVPLCLLLLSRSVTGMVAFGLVLVIPPFYRLFRQRMTVWFPVYAVIGAALLAVIFVAGAMLPNALQAMNRDPTLTGRTYVWKAVLPAIVKRRWLGYGFNSFWLGMRGESSAVMIQIGFFASQAHDGFLNLMLDLGLVGLGVFLAGYLQVLRRAFNLMRISADAIPVWFCTYLTLMLIYNFVESSILRQNDIFWALYTSVAVSVFLYVPAKAQAPSMTERE